MAENVGSEKVAVFGCRQRQFCQSDIGSIPHHMAGIKATDWAAGSTVR
jgi:hypothetical protein